MCVIRFKNFSVLSSIIKYQSYVRANVTDIKTLRQFASSRRRRPRTRARDPPRMSRARGGDDDDVLDTLDDVARRELARAIASRCADASRAVRAHERATVAATSACASAAARVRETTRDATATMRGVVREWRWMTSEETVRALEGALEEARAFRELAERFERTCDDAIARVGETR